MEILVKVQIDLSSDAKSFLASLMGGAAKKQDEAAPIPATLIPAVTNSTESKPTPVVNAKVTKQTETKVVPPPAKVETTQKPVVEVKPAVEKAPQANFPAASSTIILADVRAAAAPLIENFRAEIMTKLRSFGAVSVSTLKPEHYQPMLEFLNTLK